MRDEIMMTDHRAELAKIKRFDQLIAYLRDEMGWPIARDSFENVDDLFFEFTADELGIDEMNAAKIQEIKRLRPLSAKQPWGIFFVKFEPKRLPVVALRRILGQVALKKRASANSAERIAWSADDLLFISNYGEGEERRISFAHFSTAPEGKDLPTLKVLGWDNMDTALHLDAVAKELTQHLAWPDDESNIEAWRQNWRSAFTLRHREVINTSKELSVNLAELARSIRDRIKMALAIETEKGPLTRIMKAFQVSLVHDLDADGFADMYAQTIAYGLLSARITDPHKKTADDFTIDMHTNPFLRELMETFLKVGGRRGKAGGPGIDFDELGVSEVVELLDDANMEAVVRDFGDRNLQEDPVIHFYELFLKEYDARKRMQRGVFYTPRPVVSYIVRSVDELLRNKFGLADGLADTTTWGEMAKRNNDLNIPDGVSPDQDFVQILDPATGTGTFLVEVIDVIHKTLVAKWKSRGHDDKKIDALWNEYVPKHLLTRLHGYELLMAPYAIAHVKIGLKLYESGYRFNSDERARVYLTNALEPAQDFSGRFEFAIPALAHEARAVNKIKRHTCFTIVIGNPPYSISSSNKGECIEKLMELYKQSVKIERNIQPLSDDYIKFIRLAHECISFTRIGIAALITNHAYLSGLIHRGVREQLRSAFNSIAILDLHGNATVIEESPEGINENVFDIKQGVSISFWANTSESPKVESIRFTELWRSRETKHEFLSSHSIGTTNWKQIEPQAPYFFFVPKNFGAQEEYNKGWQLSSIFPMSTSGVTTHRDHFFVGLLEAEVRERVRIFTDASLSDKEVAEIFGLENWDFKNARARVIGQDETANPVVPYSYRPFDTRTIFYSKELIERHRYEMMRHMLAPNLGLCFMRKPIPPKFSHCMVTRTAVDKNFYGYQTYVFPLFLHEKDKPIQAALLSSESHRPNISPGFLKLCASLLGLRWINNGPTDCRKTVGPVDVFHYTYAVFYSPAYRLRYAEFLNIDFPRLPLTRDGELFRQLVYLGSKLVALHLLESPKLDLFITEYLGGPTPEVEKVSWSNNTVWLDKAQTIGFKGVREDVWIFHIGGYRVCEKWLKDRKGRTLSKDDIDHYQKIIVALNETIRLVKEIDEAIEKHGGWPKAFQTGDAKVHTADALSDNIIPFNKITPKINQGYKAPEPPLFGMAAEQGNLYGESDDTNGSEVQTITRQTYGSLEREDMICLVRKIFNDGVARERDVAISSLARELGYQRTGSRIAEELDNVLITAVRRGILDNNGGTLKLLANSIEQYDRDFLKDQFLSSLGGRQWIERDDAIRGFARWLGFLRTGPIIDETARSLINGLIRGDRLESDGTRIRRSYD